MVAAPGRPGRVGGFSAASPPPPEEEEEEESDVQVSDNGEEAGDPVGPRRNIGRDFDEEDTGGGGSGNGQARGRKGSGACEGGRAAKGGVPELAGGGSVEGDRGDIDRGSRPSSTSSSSSPSSPQREQLFENDAGGDGEAVGAMEGVHPGLATYDSQRSAAGMNGGGRAGQEEYARMLELMQKVAEPGIVLTAVGKCSSV